jgi:hypothetical protein
MRRLVAILIDLAPPWIWKSGNMRFVGAHTLHFCYGHEGRRTVEWDGHEYAAGRRIWLAEGHVENHAAAAIDDAGR